MSKEYIEREAALDAVCDGCNREFFDEPCEPPDCYIRAAMQGIPAADVVEVVRCKDCISRGTESCAMYYECDYCEEQHTWETDNDFCSYGERKQNGI